MQNLTGADVKKDPDRYRGMGSVDVIGTVKEFSSRSEDISEFIGWKDAQIITTLLLSFLIALRKLVTEM